ncbi:DUF86 domain-containing protein [Cyanobium sp. WAJ14-Wanaka]|uniref:HepT-like ribonuclease domain-containing protein n=1 Tax=Cyanobium sp. WAJ14-Wanaka TaxID=2823725 RepID=UPI0020CE28F7|nr:HepT-like ribonuclease domain-containing protein [Cyanobium sp. WAJ14-Wanaka]MCP9774938.1 DUF86 domain-containing protein [Cyanobium sp. WAJ14-Wanaka]
MRFPSEQEERLAVSVISQMLSLIESVLKRMKTVYSATDLSKTEAGRLLLDAVCMQYLALGEAVKQLDKLTGFTLQEQVPEQDGKGMMGFRDVLAHQYFNIDPRQVLWITQEALPSLLQNLKQIKASCEASG